MTVERGPERMSLREQVAEEVRVALVRQKMSGSSLARAMQREQTWVSRRLTGAVAFDMDDLQEIAGVLGIEVEVLVGTGRSVPPPRTPGSGSPRLDSNQRPTDYKADARLTLVTVAA